MSIGLDLLAAGIQEDDLGDKAFARLDVLIHNTAGSTVKQCKLLELANQLWCRGIRCSITDPGSTMDDVAGLKKFQSRYYHQAKNYYFVFVDV